MVGWLWIVKDVEVAIASCTNATNAWKGRPRLRRISALMAGFGVEIWTCDLQNAEQEHKPSDHIVGLCYCILHNICSYRIWGLIFDPEDGSIMDLRNVGILPQHCTASQPRRWRQHGPPKFGVLPQHYTASQPWRWRQHGPPKRWYPTTTLHGVTTQKTSKHHRRKSPKTRIRINLSMSDFQRSRIVLVNVLLSAWDITAYTKCADSFIC
jgi:hypothetical protein